MPSDHVRALYASIYKVVRRIPRGRVATYGQIAELAGIPGGARVAGAAMRANGGKVPWQRVIGKRGKTTGRIAILDPIGGAVQRELLEREGVEVGDAGSISLTRYGWLPTDATGSRARAAPPRRPPRSGSKRRASPSRR